MKKNRWLLSLIFILITVLTVWAIVSQSSSFDKDILIRDLKNSNKTWLILAIFAMTFNIYFEALALKEIIKTICPDYTGKGRYLLYSASDIYFSAITPFTSGGQPAMVYFMLQDKISVASITTSLILDYIACTLMNLFNFLLGLFILPSFITDCSTLTIVLVIIGAIGLIVMNVILFFLLFNPNLFKKIATWFFNLFNKIFHFKNLDSKIEKLNKTVEDYKECSLIMKKNKKMIFKVFIYTFLQKLGKTLSTVFVFFAFIDSYQEGFKVWFVQVLSDLGSSLVPIPGGIGAREYILIDGFSKMPIIDSAANLGLMCEAISFYLGIFISLLIVLIAVIKNRISKNKSTN